jgi:hypothetical protein
MRPDGNPMAVYAPQGSRPVVSDDDISVGPRLIAFTQAEVTGNIWLLGPEKGAK